MHLYIHIDFKYKHIPYVNFANKISPFGDLNRWNCRYIYFVFNLYMH